MENIAGGLENLFLDMLSLFKKLKTVCEQEQKCLSDIDVDTLWKTTEQKKKLTAELMRKRESIFVFLEQKNLMARHTAQTTTLSEIISGLPLPLKAKAELKKLIIQLNLLKTEIRIVAQENTRFVNESLSVAKGMIAMLTGSGANQEYSRLGKFQGRPNDRHFIRAEV